MKLKQLAPLGATLAFVLATPALAQDSAADHFSGPYVGGTLGYNWLPNGTANDIEQIHFDTNGDGQYGDIVRNPATGGNAFRPASAMAKAPAPPHATTWMTMAGPHGRLWRAMIARWAIS